MSQVIIVLRQAKKTETIHWLSSTLNHLTCLLSWWLVMNRVDADRKYDGCELWVTVTEKFTLVNDYIYNHGSYITTCFRWLSWPSDDQMTIIIVNVFYLVLCRGEPVLERGYTSVPGTPALVSVQGRQFPDQFSSSCFHRWHLPDFHLSQWTHTSLTHPRLFTNNICEQMSRETAGDACKHSSRAPRACVPLYHDKSTLLRHTYQEAQELKTGLGKCTSLIS